MHSSSSKFVPTSNATDAEIKKAAWGTVPPVALLFWAFRIMVELGFVFILLFGLAFYLTSTGRLLKARWLLLVLAFALPFPWIAAESGWIVAEVGRQPWVVEGVLPTFLAVSGISTSNVLVTLVGFIGFYSILLLVDVYLMVKAIRLGPGHIAPRPHALELPTASGAE
jgi:cytochrome bd ubiquinol oxidase subunit I